MLNGPRWLSTPGSSLTAEKRKNLESRVRDARTRLKSDAPIPRLAEDAAAPLSFGQERLLFLHHFETGSVAYNRPANFRLTGKLDLSVLQRCLDEIYRRHSLLRTRFASAADSLIQQTTHEGSFPLQYSDLTEVDEAGRDDRARRIAVEESRATFELLGGELVRGRLLKLAERDHLLLLTFHHAIFDAWSEQVLRRELCQLYRAFRNGEPSPLAELPIQYRDYAAWQRDGRLQVKIDSQLAYWREHLDGAPRVLELPVDVPRSATSSDRGARLTRVFPHAISQAVRGLARREGATLYSTMLAAFNILIHRHTGANDFLIGTPVAGRNRVELEPLIGLFINLLPLRARISGDDTFRTYLASVQSNAHAAFAREDLPFEKLVEHFEPNRRGGYSPLVQATFQIRNVPRAVDEVPELAIEPWAAECTTTQFDLSCEVTDREDGLECAIVYNTDLFAVQTIERMLGHFETILEQVVDDHDIPVSAISLLTPSEWKEFQQESNTIPAKFPVECCLHERIEQQAARTPDAIALTFGERHVTYRELNSRANRLARALRERGAGSDKLVALATERSIEAVVGILGILKSGAAYVPLDIAHPAERLRLLIEDAEPIALLSTRDVAPQLPQSSVPILYIDPDGKSNAGERAENLPGIAKPEHLAYVIYTSGSTGRPKGVMIEHRQVVRLFDATQAKFAFSADDTWTIFHSFAFDFSVWELFGPLLTGGRAVIVPRTVAQSPAEFLDLIRRERVTVLSQTPSAFRHLDRIDSERREAAARSLRLVIFGGETLEPGHLAGWFDRYGDATPQLVNMYGITETTVHVTLRRMTKSDLATPGRSVIGVPISDLKVLLLDQYGHPAPQGIPGEIYVGGAGVARGYLNRKDLTEMRFVRDQFVPKSPSGDVAMLYRSGDLARRGSNGELEYLGRIDQQVQIRGFRVEPGEIDAALCTHPQVAESATVAHTTADGSVILASYIVCRSHDSIAVDRLKDWLRHSLPEHMVPANFLFLKSLPLTVNGKLDRQALPLPGNERPELQEEFVLPDTADERELAEIWSELLGIDKVGVNDNFFALGGHSLMAVQLVSRVRERLFRELPLRQVFDTPTIRGLAAYLSDHADDGDARDLLPIVAVSRDEPLPLSLSQEQFTILAELDPEQPRYNESMAVRITGPLESSRLARSLNEIVKRHEILRTTVAERNGDLVQIVRPQLSVPLALVDLMDLPAEERYDAALQQADEECARLFDLRTGPLLRAVLYQLDDELHLLCLTFHHFVVDRHSFYIIINELSALYESFTRKLPSPLAALPIQYGDFAVWQRQQLRAESGALDERYWKRHLAGATPLTLPTVKKRTSETGSRGKRRRAPLPNELVRRLQEFSREEETTLFVTFLSAFKVFLGRYSAQDDVTVGSVVSERERDELRNLVGSFLNTIALRTDISGDPTFRELIGRVQKTAVDAVAHRQFPFVKLVERLHRERNNFAGNSLFNVAFVLEPLSQITGGKFSLESRKAFSGAAKFDLMLLIDQLPQGTDAVLEYNAGLFDDDTAERMLDQFLVLLEAAVEKPNLPISRLPLLGEREQRKLIADWNTPQSNAADIAAKPGETLHGLFETQAAQSPDSIAVVCEYDSITYSELNRRANALAERLMAAGVEADSLVPLCLERSVDLIVGIIGILKAGGAFVPIDPSQPANRLGWMIEDCRPKAIVTQSSLVALFDSRSASVIPIDGIDIRDAHDTNPASRAVEANLAYVIYTSGSTGRPKGVGIEHRQIVNYIRGILDRMPMTAGMRFATVSTIAADLGNTVVFPSLVCGGVLHVIAQARVTDAHGLSEYFAKHQIDCLKIVPSHLRALLSELPPERVLPRKLLILGGEASQCEWVAELQAHAPDTVIFNHYGPTETTVGVLACRVGPRELAVESGTLPLGRPLPNSQAYILDAHLQPVPVGVAGELYIGGNGVARGYLNQPELTAERFLPDPFRSETGARIYKTGDRARYLPDGRIEFLGRADNQVKIRGFRIELGEIESALCQHAGVREAVVLAVEPQPGNRRLAAYVVPQLSTFHTLDTRRTYALPNGMRIRQINKNETDYIYHEVFELQAYLKHGITLRSGDCVFDVGANIGLFTLFASRVAPDLKIHAFEPNPFVHEALATNAAAYGNSIKTFNFGLSNRNGEAEFRFFEGFSLLSGYYADADTEREVVKQYLQNQQREGTDGAAEFTEQADELLEQRFRTNTFKTELRTLSSVIETEGIERIDLLKINVEKSELDVLSGIAEQDWPKIAQLVVEVDVAEHLPQIELLLARNGFEVLVEQDRLLNDTALCYVYAIRPTNERRLIRDQPAGGHLLDIPAISGGVPTPTELQEHLKRLLPDYMVPDSIVLLTELPLNANGKLDRQKLASTDAGRPSLSEPYVAPRTPLEEILAETWQGVLNVERVGINDNFFELGGHSLLAMRVAARLRSEFNLELSVRALFESPTVASLALVMFEDLIVKVGYED